MHYTYCVERIQFHPDMVKLVTKGLNVPISRHRTCRWPCDLENPFVYGNERDDYKDHTSWDAFCDSFSEHGVRCNECSLDITNVRTICAAPLEFDSETGVVSVTTPFCSWTCVYTWAWDCYASDYGVKMTHIYDMIARLHTLVDHVRPTGMLPLVASSPGSRDICIPLLLFISSCDRKAYAPEEIGGLGETPGDRHDTEHREVDERPIPCEHTTCPGALNKVPTAFTDHITPNPIIN